MMFVNTLQYFNLKSDLYNGLYFIINQVWNQTTYLLVLNKAKEETLT